MRNFIRKVHVADIYDKTIAEQPSGQKKATWVSSYQDVKCMATPTGASAKNRVGPTAEQRDFLTVFFDHNVSISSGSRVYNIRTSVGNDVVYAGPYEVDTITKHVTFSGKVDYIVVILKSVIE